MQSAQQALSERNRQIRMLMELFNCSYARATQLYYIVRNYDDTQATIYGDGYFESK